MSCILHIDTSTNVCSVAVSENGGVIFNKENHNGLIMPKVSEAMSMRLFPLPTATPFLSMPWPSAAAPGSYTGLRIGVSMAKGICYGQGLHLVSVPTLELLCVPVLLRHDEMEENALLVPMIDARRMEVYAQVFDRALRTVRPVQADVVDEETYREYLDRGPVYFFGNGAEKCMESSTTPMPISSKA